MSTAQHSVPKQQLERKPNSPIELTILPTLMDERDLAAYLKKSVAWAQKARWAGEGPRFIKLGRHVRYRAEDVLAWMEENTRTSTCK